MPDETTSDMREQFFSPLDGVSSLTLRQSKAKYVLQRRKQFIGVDIIQKKNCIIYLNQSYYDRYVKETNNQRFCCIVE